MIQLNEIEQRLVDAINAWRAERGLWALAVDETLQEEARRAAPYGSHTIRGQWVWNRLHERGFRGVSTDNVAIGYESPEAAVEGWGKKENSVGHDRQLAGERKIDGRWIDEKFDLIGASADGLKYIAIFARHSVRTVPCVKVFEGNIS